MLLSILSAGVLAFAATPKESYSAGRAAYNAKEYHRAGEIFRSLLHETPTVSSPARYALANSLVQRARTADSTGPTANAWLREAVDHYRTLLDGGVDAPLQADDVRCNLAIAKRSLNWSKAPGDESLANDSSKPRPTDAKNGSATVSTPAKKASTSADPSRQTDDKGEVLSPTAGIPFVDPGPIPRSAAEQQIAERVRRLEQEAKEKTPTQPIFRPATKDDY